MCIALDMSLTRRDLYHIEFKELKHIEFSVRKIYRFCVAKISTNYNFLSLYPVGVNGKRFSLCYVGLTVEALDKLQFIFLM